MCPLLKNDSTEECHSKTHPRSPIANHEGGFRLGSGVTALFVALLFGVFVRGTLAESPPFVEFKVHEVDSDCGIGRAVSVVDVDGDDKPDIVGLTSNELSWYKNPTWEKRLIASNLDGTNICMAPYDLDGDGLPELALGSGWNIQDTQGGGSLHILRRDEDLSLPWKAIRISEEPTLHRVCWADLDGVGGKELIVAPLKGRGSQPPYFREPAVRILRFVPPENPFSDEWKVDVVDDEKLSIAHGLRPFDWNGDGKETLLVASIAGVTRFKIDDEGKWIWHQVTSGNPLPFPACGAGEVGIGDYKTEKMMATIEPWHGNQAVVYTLKLDREESRRRFDMWTRHVIDDSLVGGHVLEWADFDGDGRDDLLIGFREPAGPKKVPGLNVYQIGFYRDDETVLKSHKRVIDDGGIATESAAVADLNGDGFPDIVAIGRATKNLRYYENLGNKN